MLRALFFLVPDEEDIDWGDVEVPDEDDID